MMAMMMAGISSCATNSQRLTIAATEHGKADAGVHLADLPAEFRKQEPHADLTGRVELHAKLDEEREALDRANDRVARIADFYDDQKNGLEKQ